MTLLDAIRAAARKRLLFLPHAVHQMSRPDRMIRPEEVRAVVAQGEIIEEYPEDPRGPSALLLGLGDADRVLHVVAAPKQEYLAIITAYLPDAAQWETDLKTRRPR